MTGDSWLPSKFGARPATIPTEDVKQLDSADLVHIAHEMENFMTDEANRNKWGVPGHSWSIFRHPTEGNSEGNSISFVQLQKLESLEANVEAATTRVKADAGRDEATTEEARTNLEIAQGELREFKEEIKKSGMNHLIRMDSNVRADRKSFSKIYSCTGFANLDEKGKPPVCKQFISKFEVKAEEQRALVRNDSFISQEGEYSDRGKEVDAMGQRLGAQESLAKFCKTCNQVGDAHALLTM